MGAASSIKPASVAPEKAALGSSRSRFYGFPAEETVDKENPSQMTNSTVNFDGEEKNGVFKSPTSFGVVFAETYPTNRDRDETEVHSNSGAFFLRPSEQPRNPSSEDAVEAAPGIASTTISARTMEVAAETMEKLGMINAAAVNGDKSSLVRVLDGDCRLLWLRDDFGRTPLMMAVLADRPEIAQLVFKKAHKFAAATASTSSPTSADAEDRYLEIKDKGGRTALHCAAHKVILSVLFIWTVAINY